MPRTKEVARRGRGKRSAVDDVEMEETQSAVNPDPISPDPISSATQAEAKPEAMDNSVPPEEKSVTPPAGGMGTINAYFPNEVGKMVWSETETATSKTVTCKIVIEEQTFTGSGPNRAEAKKDLANKVLSTVTLPDKPVIVPKKKTQPDKMAKQMAGGWGMPMQQGGFYPGSMLGQGLIPSAMMGFCSGYGPSPWGPVAGNMGLGFGSGPNDDSEEEASATQYTPMSPKGPIPSAAADLNIECQKAGCKATFDFVDASPPDAKPHDKQFTCRLSVKDATFEQTGRNKKHLRVACAKLALAKVFQKDTAVYDRIDVQQFRGKELFQVMKDMAARQHNVHTADLVELNELGSGEGTPQQKKFKLVVDLDGKQYEGPTDHAKKKARQLGAKQILVEAFSFDKDDVEYLMREAMLINSGLAPRPAVKNMSLKNMVQILKEVCQQQGHPDPEYVSEGPKNLPGWKKLPFFTSQVTVDGKTFEATCSNKKLSKERAARRTLEAMEGMAIPSEDASTLTQFPDPESAVPPGVEKRRNMGQMMMGMPMMGMGPQGGAYFPQMMMGGGGKMPVQSRKMQMMMQMMQQQYGGGGDAGYGDFSKALTEIREKTSTKMGGRLGGSEAAKAATPVKEES